MPSHFERVEVALNDLRQGKMIILTDNPGRENEGDLIFPAEKTTPALINFMIRYCSGIICLSLPQAKIEQLGLSLMVPYQENTSKCGTPFTVSIEAKKGVTTGVSAADRAKTILTVINKHATAQDIVKPGHIFPLQAREGGVFIRPGHTEGAIDIVRLAGFEPAAVLCEVMNKDGTMARGNKLEKFAQKHHINMLSIEDIIDYRRTYENLIDDEVTSELPTAYGTFKLSVVKEKYNGHEHIVLMKENQNKSLPTLIRIHSSCVTGDLFESKRCDCHQQLHYFLQRMGKEGGMLIYLNQEGRGIGLFNKIKAYVLQEQGLDTIEANQKIGFPADPRNYYIAANILRNRNIKHIRLVTNNPAKMNDLKKYGIPCIDQESMPIFCNEHNKNYLYTKKTKLNHIINDDLLFMGERR